MHGAARHPPKNEDALNIQKSSTRPNHNKQSKRTNKSNQNTQQQQRTKANNTKTQTSSTTHKTTQKNDDDDDDNNNYSYVRDVPFPPHSSERDAPPFTGGGKASQHT